MNAINLEIAKIKESKRFSLKDSEKFGIAAEAISKMEDKQAAARAIFRLVNGYPITSLSGTREEWSKEIELGNVDIYENTRYPRLQATVERSTGKIINYHEAGRAMGVLTDGSNKTQDDSWQNMANDIGHAIKPIKFPYFPSTGKYIIYATRLVTYKDIYVCFVNKIEYPRDLARKTEFVRKYYAWRIGYWAEEVSKDFWKSVKKGTAKWSIDEKNGRLFIVPEKK